MLPPTAHLLITGGAGFLGSHLADRWLAQGGAVTLLDDLSAGASADAVDARTGGRARLVVGSVLDEGLVGELVARADGVAHLAAVVGVERVVREPARTLEVGTRGGQVVLAAALAQRRPVLVVSSSEVYGPDSSGSYREDGPLALVSPERARGTYAVSKLHSESLALALHRERGLAAVVARLFNTSGPGQGPASGMVLPRFVEAALAGEPLLVHGDGSQRRVFCHVLDAVDALVRLLTRQEARGGLFNVGGRDEVSMAALAELVRDRLGSASRILFCPVPTKRGDPRDDTRRRVPDLARIRATVGWEPTRDLGALVDDLAAEFRPSR